VPKKNLTKEDPKLHKGKPQSRVLCGEVFLGMRHFEAVNSAPTPLIQ
jgi:hypothetical protein